MGRLCMRSAASLKIDMDRRPGSWLTVPTCVTIRGSFLKKKTHA